GAWSPVPLISAPVYQEALRTIIEPTLRGLREDGAPFQGCLYGGMMSTADGVKVIEFNCRFGDPEAEAVLPLLESELLPLLAGSARGALPAEPLSWRPASDVCVVMASGGYPGAFETGQPIAGLEEADARDVLVFHAGTSRRDGGIVTSGGRVL